MKRVLFSLLTMVCTLLSVNAYDFMVDGLAYRINFDGSTVTLTYEQEPQNLGWDSQENLPIWSPAYTNLVGAVTIPSTVTYGGKTYTVTTLGQKAFHACASMTSVSIPATVNAIEYNPFEHCNALEQITVDPNNSIYDSRDNCNAIMTKQAVIIDVYYQVEGGGWSIPQSYDKDQLVVGCKGTVIPASATSVGYYAFHEMNSVTEIVVPEGVTKVDQYAFDNCRRLTTLTLPSTLTYIGSCGFSSCSKLRDVYAYFNPANVGLGFAVWQMVLLPTPWNPAVNLHVYPEYVAWYMGQADDSPWVSDGNRFNVLGDLGQSLTLKGSFDGWQEGLPFEMNADGMWVVTTSMEPDAEFKLLDQDNTWWGGVDEYNSGNFLITETMIANGSEIALVDGSNFKIPVGGVWTFTADMVNKKLYVTGTEFEHLYIMGQVNGNFFAANVGVDMETTDGIVYTSDVTINENEGSGNFYFSTKLGADAGDFSGIYNYCLGAVTAEIDEFQLDVTADMLGQELPLASGNKAFCLANGDYTMTVNYADMTLKIEKVATGLKGDVNGDGEVDVRDITALIDVIMNSVTDNPRADVNEDGEIDVRDITALIDIIMNS